MMPIIRAAVPAALHRDCPWLDPEPNPDVADRFSDILVVPDLQAGNLLAKTRAYLAAAESGGVVLGARVPIVLTSRASARNREASAAVMALLAHSRREQLGGR